MEYGIGVDASLGLSFAESRALVAEAAALGYQSAWTPSGPPTRDGFQVCAQWHGATTPVVDGGLTTGIAVIPVPVWTVQSLAQQAGAPPDGVDGWRGMSRLRHCQGAAGRKTRSASVTSQTSAQCSM